MKLNVSLMEEEINDCLQNNGLPIKTKILRSGIGTHIHQSGQPPPSSFLKKRMLIIKHKNVF
jgi:hypothetical protein